MSRKRCLLILTVLLAMTATYFGQSRQPSTPAKPFVVKTRQSVDELERSLRTDNKVEDLTGGAGTQLRVAVQHDKKRIDPDAEVHDESDDVYYVLSGTARLTLGGSLNDPREASHGEWKSKKIIGGTTLVIKQGDLIIVPRGTPHQRSTIGTKEFSMILIKVFKDPQKGK
ncbi:MAG: cupin domain-containing protein [Pyrinomonadaceae bacterium]